MSKIISVRSDDLKIDYKTLDPPPTLIKYKRETNLTRHVKEFAVDTEFAKLAYLSENKILKKALSVYIVCAPFDNDLPTEDLVGGFKLKKDLSLLEENCRNLYVMFSEDDDVVPVSHADKYRKKLKEAEILTYDHMKGHFTAPKFPEIIKLIRQDTK